MPSSSQYSPPTGPRGLLQRIDQFHSAVKVVEGSFPHLVLKLMLSLLLSQISAGGVRPRLFRSSVQPVPHVGFEPTFCALQARAITRFANGGYSVHGRILGSAPSPHASQACNLASCPYPPFSQYFQRPTLLFRTSQFPSCPGHCLGRLL